MKKIFNSHLLLWVIPLLILMTPPSASAGHDQQILDREVSLDLRDVPLAAALTQIESVADVKFVYSPSQIDLQQIVSVAATDKKLGAILNDLLGPLGISYNVDRGKEFILLKPMKALQSHPENNANPTAAPELAQAQTVTGTVTDAATHQPIAGVNVVVKGTTFGTTSGSNGMYSINAESKDILIFSFIGYKKFETQVAVRAIIDVSLEEDISSLQEVVVNAGYYNVTDKTKTGNITKITAAEIQHQPITSPLLALQGRVPGLEIDPRNGVPGSAPIIRIRGQNSLGENGNYPLYVVDGVPVDSSPLQSYSFGAFDPLSTLNADNIASIEILKDADATAIYGSRGANGVILITTKKANVAGKTTFDLNAYSGVGKIVNRMELLNTQQYLTIRKEAFANAGATPGFFDYDVNGAWDSTRYTNWQDVLLGGSAGIQDVQAAMTGGGENTSFRVGIGYHQENTVYPGDFGFNSMTGNLSLSHRSPQKKFSTGLSISYGATQNKLCRFNFVRSALTLPPNSPELYTDDGDLNWDIKDYFGYRLNSWTNPMSELFRTHDVSSTSLIVNGSLGYEIMPALFIRANLGFTELNSSEILKFPLSSQSPTSIYPNSTAQSVFGRNDRNSWIAEPQLIWAKTFHEQSLEVLLGSTFQSALNDYQSIRGNGYVSDVLLNTLQGATSTTILDDFSAEYKYAAAFARIGYDLKKKYLLNLTGRRDGSSRFGPQRQFGNFGAIGVAWVFSSEKLFADHLPFVSFGKLRASYGVTGNDQIGDYKYYDTYHVSPNLYQGRITLTPTALFNADFSWEETRKLETAIEMGLFEDRLMLQASWYQNRSSNQLINSQLPAVTGFTSVFANFDATVENSGWEGFVNINPINSQNFTWTASGNISANRNKLIAFPGIETSPYANQFKVGKPLSVQQLYTYEGVNPATGDNQVVDVNSDGLIDNNDLELKNAIGRTYYGGLNNAFRFKSIELSFLLQFTNQKVFGYQFELPGAYPGNLPVETFQRWQKEGDHTTIPKPTTDFNTLYNYSKIKTSDYFIVDASFIRLKTLSFSWLLPEAWLTKIKFDQVRIFLQGQNLLTFTSFTGFDPETGVNLPPIKTVSAGFHIKL